MQINDDVPGPGPRPVDDDGKIPSLPMNPEEASQFLKDVLGIDVPPEQIGVIKLGLDGGTLTIGGEAVLGGGPTGADHGAAPRERLKVAQASAAMTPDQRAERRQWYLVLEAILESGESGTSVEKLAEKLGLPVVTVCGVMYQLSHPACGIDTLMFRAGPVPTEDRYMFPDEVRDPMLAETKKHLNTLGD